VSNKTADFIKDPYVKTVFKTDKELEDFIKCCDPDTGYLYFMDNFFMIQHPTKGAINYHPWEFQRRLIHTYHTSVSSISLMPRQTGKTTSAAGYLLWYAMFNPDSTILIAAHKYTGAQEIMQRIRYGYENCPNHIKAGVTTYNKGSIDFENGSRIVSATTTETTGRGMSITLLYLDEFAFVRPTIAEQFWTSITPTLATGGKCIITSTPNSDEDQFALLWKGANKCEDAYGNPTELGINGFKAFRSHWYEHPERDDAWAAAMEAKLGNDRFRREILCDFLIAEETLINPNTLIDLAGIEPNFRMGQVRWYAKPTPNNVYVIGLDPSLGTGGDNAAIQIFEANTTTQIGEWKHNKTTIPEQIKLLADITKYIAEQTKQPNNIYYSLENNSIGEAALISLHEYGESNISGNFISEPGKKRRGFNTTHKTKVAACAKFKTLLESKRLKINSGALISELKTFVAHNQSYAAKLGEKDDLVMATLLVVRILQQISDYHGDLEAQIRDHEDFISPFPFFAVFS
jgi:Terminase large subunit, T4likevirus-type, N-terminal/Terminase RNaseH-like domain